MIKVIYILYGPIGFVVYTGNIISKINHNFINPVATIKVYIETNHSFAKRKGQILKHEARFLRTWQDVYT